MSNDTEREELKNALVATQVDKVTDISSKYMWIVAYYLDGAAKVILEDWTIDIFVTGKCSCADYTGSWAIERSRWTWNWRKNRTFECERNKIDLWLSSRIIHCRPNTCKTSPFSGELLQFYHYKITKTKVYHLSWIPIHNKSDLSNFRDTHYNCFL